MENAEYLRAPRVRCARLRDKEDPPYAICVIRNSVPKSHYLPQFTNYQKDFYYDNHY